VVVALGAALTFLSTVGIATADHALVVAHAETEPVPHEDDAADDPAIWVNPLDPAASTVIGVDKQGGIAVYDLSGRELQYLPDGNLNNVDLRADFPLGGESVTVVTASNRTDNSIAIYRIDPETGLLSDVAARQIDTGFDVYGSCMYRDADGQTYTYVNSKDGEVEQWRLSDNGAGLVDAEMVRSFDAGSQVEGCVADDEFGRLYIGEETVGIWEYAADAIAEDERTLVASVDNEGPLVGEVEGLTIAYGPDGTGYLLASSQGDNTFAVFERSSPHELVLTFAIGDGQVIDGTTTTDGIDVSTANLGPAFPTGLFVAHDGENDDGNQNYKLVSWDAIASELPAPTDAG
jgi:3-phytase